jgi:FkbM family methyltransferase
MAYYSQEAQDKYLEERVFRGHRDGFFVDVGAHDGRTINNTLFFSESRGWKGINIEPLPEVFQKLVVNRPCDVNIQVAVDTKEGEVEFFCNTGYTEMISGIKSHYDPRHKNRLDWEIGKFGGQSKTILVKTRTLESIFDERKIKEVNYLSVDVEGAEYAVIKSIEFDKVHIDVIGFENNFPDSSGPIIGYLEAKGYRRLDYQGVDIMMIHKKSKFAI